MSTVTYCIEKNIAIVILNNPPVNAINHAARQGLWDARNQADTDGTVQVVLLICEGTSFVSGAYIKEFGSPRKEPFYQMIAVGMPIARHPRTDPRMRVNARGSCLEY